jgi:hypothetical protein
MLSGAAGLALPLRLRDLVLLRGVVLPFLPPFAIPGDSPYKRERGEENDSTALG